MPIFSAVAANDEIYSAGRCRTNAVPESISFIPGYPRKLRIFLTNASCYWQVRCFFNGKTYTKSLRTTRRKEALTLARDYYNTMLIRIYGESYIERTPSNQCLFRSLVPKVIAIEENRVQRGDLSADGLRIFRNRMNKNVLPFFGERALDTVDYGTLNDFVSHISEKSKSPTTISQYLTAVRRVLNYAVSKGILKSLPAFPKVKIIDSPRSSFNAGEYLRLYRAAKFCIGDDVPISKTEASKWKIGKLDRHFYVPEELRWVVRFMVNSFIRPTDLRYLQHQHVEIVRNDYTYLRLNLPESKKHDRPIVSMPAAVGVYERLLHHAQANGYGGRYDYLFMPHIKDRKKAIEQLAACFKHVLITAKLDKSPKDGKQRTLYCLRHTSITFRLRYGEGIDLITLARNARTSVEMIERFYSSNLSAEMNIGMLHSRRSRNGV